MPQPSWTPWTSSAPPRPSIPAYYLANYVVEIWGLGSVPHELAFTELLQRPTSAEVCSDVSTTAKLYAYDPALGYWYVLGPETTKSGRWVAGSGGFFPSYCDTRIAWTVPSSVTRVILDGKVTSCWYGS